MGHFLAEQRYGTTASCQGEQHNGTPFCQNSYTGHPHIDVLEYFNPNLSTDPFNWVPKGLLLDLVDNTPNETIANGYYVNDNVSGYTIQQLFTAYQADVMTLQQYRDRLLQQNNYNQQAQVIDLFKQYGYQ